MTNYKEILTKAIIGKCKKTTTNNYELSCTQNPNTILGCWIINHSFNGLINKNEANINGKFDVNVWYSYDNDTKTAVDVQTFNYNDLIKVQLKSGSKIDNNNEIVVECLKQPTVKDVNLKDGIVSLKVEKEMGVEIIGNTMVKIQVEDDYDEYDEVFDTPDEDELNLNLDNIDENYIGGVVNN